MLDSLAVKSESYLRDDAACSFAQKHNLTLLGSRSALPDCVLHFSESATYLSFREGKVRLKLELDFVHGALAHRRKFGGGKGQAIAKAIGISAKFKPSVLDCTAGQGRDAFVFASLGSQVTMLERSPIAHLLLEDALVRADLNIEVSELVARLSLQNCSAHEYLSSCSDSFDVVYLDPMFPERKKNALVKKEMRIFHKLIGSDEDADALLALAKEKAIYRVVVKRPKIAPYLDDQAPTYQLTGKSSRFDIYALKSMPT